MASKKKKDTQKKKISQKQHEEDVLDKALRDSFPASDPVSLTQPAPEKEEDRPEYREEQPAPGP